MNPHPTPGETGTRTPTGGAAATGDETVPGAWRRLGHNPRGIPHVPLDEETRLGADLPRTLVPAPAGVDQPAVFDPALRHFQNAFRGGEPRFPDEASARAWRRARRTVHATIAAGPWAGHLMLRGSVLMATWFGDAAREPGDLDFVVVPQDWSIDEPRTADLFTGIAQDAAAAGSRAGSTVRIDAAGMVTEDIWAYERVPGRRMLLPRTAPGTPGGTVQLDLVFNESLPAPPVPTELRPLGDGPGCRLPAASPELHFTADHPWAEGRLAGCEERLGRALAPLLAAAEPPGEDVYDRTARWLHPLVRSTRAVSVSSDPASVAAALGRLVTSGREGLLAAVVTLREVVGRRAIGLDDALRTVLSAHEGWAYWRKHPDRATALLDDLR